MVSKAELERIADGLASGSGEAPNGHNIVGAANTIVNILEPVEQYDAMTVKDLTDDEKQRLSEAQTDLQWHLAELGEVLGNITGNDGTVELSNGSTVELPNKGSSAAKSADIPEHAQ